MSEVGQHQAKVNVGDQGLPSERTIAKPLNAVQHHAHVCIATCRAGFEQVHFDSVPTHPAAQHVMWHTRCSQHMPHSVQFSQFQLHHAAQVEAAR